MRTYRIKPTFAGPVPKCVDAETFEEWQRLERHAPVDGMAGFCEDCTPVYQWFMRELHRCENAGVTFVVGQDGQPKGRAPLIVPKARKS